MTPEEQEAMKTENAQLKTDNKKLQSDVEKKDSIIEQKNTDLIGIRKKYAKQPEYKKLDDMTDEEKAEMSEQDINRKKEQDALFEQQETDRAAREDERTRTITERRNAAISKFAGEDQELATKIGENFDKIKDSDAAFTEGEIGDFVKSAYNMLGEVAPDPMQQAVVDVGGGEAPIVGGNAGEGFAATEQGQQAAGALGLSFTREEKADNA